MFSCESSNLRILVVDDHELTRLTIELALLHYQNIEVVGCASNGKEAIEMVKRHQPHVVILDLQMPIMDGWTASTRIKVISPDTQILAYTSLEDTHMMDDKHMNDFDCICPKDIPIGDLITLVTKLGENSNHT